METSSTDKKLSKARVDKRKEENNELVYSYQTLRNLIGFSGMLLSVALVLFTAKHGADKAIEPSISDYYYTSRGDVLVVMLSVLGVFLFTYNGYNWKEKALTNLAAICGLGVAFSPTTSKYHRESLTIHTPQPIVPEIFGIQRHFVFAGTFFIALAIISLVYFPKSKDVVLTEPSGNYSQKYKRNIVYKICGHIILASLLILGVYFIWPAFSKAIGDFPIILLMETIAVEAFAISWLTKGQTFFPDGPSYIQVGFRYLKQMFK